MKKRKSKQTARAPRPFKKKLRHQPAQEAEKKKSPLKTSRTIVGVVGKARFGWTLDVADRKDKNCYIIRNPAKAAEHAGCLVAATLTGATKKNMDEVQITHNLGDAEDPRNISLIAIHANEIPLEFPKKVLEEADAAGPARTNKHREDLRDIPFVTIDGADARDFDDAVFAEKDGEGWHLIVAIADVAHYVRKGSALDKEAYKRGNSTYFPDRVVPMLPEALSNGLCSLMPHVNRACLAVHIWIDGKGEMTKWKFVRGLMKSAARLTYEQVQAAKDGNPDDVTEPLLKKIILPLYGAYDCLMAARLKRGTLELDLPERKAKIGKDGSIEAIEIRARLESHKLIEEFMIAANVAAAVQLEGKGGRCLYRVHDKPTEIKLEALRDFLDTVGISLVPSKQLHPRMLTQILEMAAGTDHAEVVNEVMLRSQAQAIYSHENIGHFGLALAKYAHFTSPIRRYADLIVHRGLIRACGFGDDGLSDEESKKLESIADHISATERRSITAEREATDKYTALFLSDKVGAVFNAQISGVARFGLFARLDDTGADGIIPFKALGRDFYELDEKKHALIGKRHGHVFQLGQKIKVRLEEANRLTGGMSFALAEPVGKARKSKKN